MKQLVQVKIEKRCNVNGFVSALICLPLLQCVLRDESSPPIEIFEILEIEVKF